jgi:hypothetical protein
MCRFPWLLVVVCGGLAACSVNTQATGTGSPPDAGLEGMAGAAGDGGGVAGSGGQPNCFPTPDQKFCGESCPPKDDPSFGCAEPSCAACSLPNAVAGCAGSGQCDIQSCSSGFSDCNNDPSDGCEVNTANDPHNCGSCGDDCSASGGATNWACNQGKCQVSNCPVGQGDCNSDASDGCETDLVSDAKNCSFCGNDCGATVQHAALTCSSSTCGYTKCDAGWADCDGNTANGCEQDVSTDATHCGGCNTVCNSTNGKAACVAGKCAITCNPGYGDCSNGTSDGCETDLLTSTAHCGKCNTACKNQYGSTSCSNGTCNPQCSSGYANCDGNKANGCEANTNRDGNNCGGCGKKCSGGQTCQGGSCACPSGTVPDNGTCCKPKDASCYQNGDCCSNHCGHGHTCGK